MLSSCTGLGGPRQERQLIRLSLRECGIPPRMVALLQELQPDLAEDSDQEVELDIDALDAKVLWRLQEYVNSLNMMGPVAKPAGGSALNDGPPPNTLVWQHQGSTVCAC